MTGNAIVWLRRDLRLADHPALAAAVARGAAVVPAWIHAPEEEGESAPGAAARVFLHGALESLSEALRARGSRLTVRRGPSVRALIDLARESGADAVYGQRVREPALLSRDDDAVAALRANGVEVHLFEDGTLFPPEATRTASGGPFRVFTPFWRRCAAQPPPGPPIPAPAALRPPARFPDSLALEQLRLLPAVPWDAGIREAWPAGEEQAAARLDRFLDGPIASYPADRDRPATRGTSGLSPYLHFGCASVRQIWYAVQGRAAVDDMPGAAAGAEAFLRQLGWREFARHVLSAFPDTVRSPMRPEFADFPWRDDPEGLDAWRNGRTGYPMVDAGMRQLWATGWMHNRVRMIAASFLVKDLLLPWQTGAAWFMDTLADADLANNTMGWQWVAGCGADAAPYYRVFNPVLQGVKFDPRGEYVRAWVPELAALPDRWVHCPWEAPAAALSRAGITLGKT
ncbi:MAG: cryptochrome/photolyase family protein [Verrucomicrobiota bacterium]